MKRPAFIVLLILLAGRILGMSLELPSWLLLTALGFLLISQGWLFFARQKLQGLPTSGYLLVTTVLLLGLHQQRLIVENDKFAAHVVERLSAEPESNVRAILAGEPEYRSDYVRLPLTNLEISLQGKTISLKSRAIVYLYGWAAEEIQKNDPMRGDAVHLRSRIKKQSSLRNPSLPDYRERLKQRGIHLTFRIIQPEDIGIAPPHSGRAPINKFLHAISLFRNKVASLFDSSLSQSNAALLKGLAMGRSEDISPADRDAFQRTGLLHLFSVSGLHTGMIAALVFILLRLTYLNIRSAAIATMILVWLFTLYAGFQSPVLRSAVMISMLLSSYWLPGLKRPLDGLSLLSFAAFWTLIFNPRALSQTDFQQSYICVAGMVFLLPFFKEHFFLNLEFAPPAQKAIRAKINHYILFPFFMVLAIQLTMLPLLAHYYHRVSPASFMANPIAIPFAFLCLAFAVAMALAGYVLPIMISPLGAIAGILLNFLRGIVHLIADIPGASIHLEPLPWFFISIYYAILFSGNWMLEKKSQLPGRKARFIIALAFLVAMLVWLPILQGGRPDMEVVFFDVGQGDSAYIEFADGSNMLIDGGRDVPRNMGEQVIIPYLEKRGVASLDAVVATHSDSDHIGGLPAIFEHIFVNRLFISEGVADDSQRDDLIESARSWGATIKETGAGDKLEGFADASVDVLNPPRPIPAWLSDNDRSLVLRIKKGSSSILFAGDAEFFAEKYMLESGADLESAVLKAGHHGSRASTSKAFLDAVKPHAAVISVGADTAYRHPHDETLKKFAERGIRVYRTDRHGAVMMKIKGGIIEITAMNRKDETSNDP